MRKRILFVIPSLAGGGAEKVLLNILKYLDRKQFIPYLAVFDYKGEYLKDVPEDIVVFDMKKRNRFGFFKLVLVMAFTILPGIKPDAVVSFLVYANLVAVIAKIISPVKPQVLINERNYTLKAERNIRTIRIKEILIRKIYPRADRIITVSSGILSDLNKKYMIPEKKLQVIYNGVDINMIRGTKEDEITDIDWFIDDTPIISACGRLIYQKNYPLLLKAFALAQTLIDMKLLILGQGKDKNMLKGLVDKMGIKKKVLFMGFQKNPYKYIKASKIFILSSRWEGFPNVILEAMACGVPVISTRYPGVQEVIDDGADGIIVPSRNPDMMAEKIVRLFKDKKLSEGLVNRGYQKLQDFRVDKMVERFSEEINSVSG
jgi:glycosyltransferase involved in cell wall biosynthesis